jgi:hypothetical protein
MALVTAPPSGSRDTPVPGSRLRRISPPMLLAGGLLAASVALHVRDPHHPGSWGYCPWLMLTGTYCPGCGGLRAVNDLTRGDFAGAASSNLLFVASLPAIAFFWLRSVHQRWTGVRRPLPMAVLVTLMAVALVLVVVFWVVRNLPAGSWLAP